jgi:predicted DNA binding CopG/RHH family protein
MEGTKSKFIRVRVSDEDLALIKEYGKKTGMTMSEILRYSFYLAKPMLALPAKEPSNAK